MPFPVRLACALIVCLALAPVKARADSWETRASMQTPRKYLAAAAPVGSTEIYAVGGRNDAGTGVLATTREYDPSSDTWTVKSSMSVARAGLTAVTVGAKIYAIGGYDSSLAEVAEVETYNVVVNKWSVVSSMVTPRSNPGAAEVGGIIYVAGGKSGTKYMSTLEAYDTVGGSWSTKAEMPTARSRLAAVAIGNTVFFLGGAIDDTDATAVIEAYDTLKDEWWPLPTDLIFTRKSMAAVSATHYYPSSIFVFGGDQGGMMSGADDDVVIYNVATKTRSLGVPMPVKSRFLGAAAVSVGSPGFEELFIYVIGGENADGFRDDNQWYDPDNVITSWADPFGPNAREKIAGPRGDHAVAARGGRIYVIGGKAEFLDANEVYDSVTDAWFTRSGMPTARSGIALARTATGRKLYAVGGTNHKGVLDAAEEYDPATDSWRTVTPMPTKRKYATAAFAGRKLYVVGGLVSGTTLATVEAYDPRTDTWEEKTSMPTARFLATAVALNGSIYVTGGVTVRRTGPFPPFEPGGGSVAIVYVDATEVYDPATNSWTSVPYLPDGRLGCGAASPGNGQIYVAGGVVLAGCTSGTVRHNPDLGAWEDRASMNEARLGLAMVAPDASGSVFAVGGERASYVNLEQDGTWESSGTLLSDAEVYMRDPARLDLQLSIVPPEVEPGNTFTVTGTVKNTGDAVATTVGAQVGPTGGSSIVNTISVPGGVLTLTPGESTSFVATYSGNGAGLISFSFTTTGIDAVTAAPLSATAYSSPPIICAFRADLSSSLEISPLPLMPGDMVSVVLTITNTGGGTAFSGSASLAVEEGAGLVSLASGPSPSGTVTITPLSGTTFVWTFSVSGSGYVVFSALGSWTDVIFGIISTAVKKSTQPSAPLGLKATPGTGRVTLTWSANPPGEGVTAYRVYRRTPGGAATLIVTVTNPGYVDTGLANAQAYLYSVAAVNADGGGLRCPEVTVEPVVFPGQAGDIWISSTGNLLETLAVNPARGERVQILMNVPLGTGLLKLAIYTLVGEKVRDLFHGIGIAGEMIVEWDGRNDNGRLVASGGYLLAAELPDGRRVVRKIAVVK